MVLFGCWMTSNKALLRVAKGEAFKVDTPSSAGNSGKIAVTHPNMARLLLNRCQACHNLPETVSKMRIPATWLQKNNNVLLIEERVFNAQMRPMPPSSPLLAEEQAILRDWLSSM